jgi:hypothetical protein
LSKPDFLAVDTSAPPNDADTAAHAALVIVPRMRFIVAVREVEHWTSTNLVGGLLLLAAVTWLVVWAVRRFLRS